MIDFNSLLGSVLGGGQNAGGQQPGPGGAPAPGQAPGQGMPGFLSSGVATFGAGALTGGLASALFGSKHMRKFAGGALQMGAAAVLGGLAYKAYNDYKAGRPVLPQGVTDALGRATQGQVPAVPAAPTAGFLSRPAEVPVDATLVLRAMIASAMADGRIDETERHRLIDRVEASGFSAEEKQYLESLIGKPDTPQALAAAARTPEAASQVYLAAYVAIDADTPAETAWLDQLAAALGLAPQLRANLEAMVRQSFDGA